MKLDVLEKIGLNPNESYIYNILLTSGELNAPAIAEKAHLKLTRQNTYTVLKSLVKKGLIEEFDKRKKLTYRVEHPQKLLETIENQKKELEENEKTIEALMPEIISDYNLAHNKPGIVYYEGLSGVKKIFEDVYSPGKDEVCGCVDPTLFDKSFDIVFKTLVPQRIKNKLFSKAILTDSAFSKAMQKKDNEQHRKSILVDPKKYPITAEIDVYEDKIAMMDVSKGKNFIGIVIENKAISETLRSIFKLAMNE